MTSLSVNSTQKMNETFSSCIPLAWSEDASDLTSSSLHVCIVAAVFHTIFWLIIVLQPSLRQWTSMQWIYAFLLVDLLLILRFFILFFLRTSSACVSRAFEVFVCYFNATGDIYLNFLQSYILLALNVCRYVQITRGGADIYSIYRRRMFLIHSLIYLTPLFALIFEILIGWAVSYRRSGGSCGLAFPLLSTRIPNTIIGYCIPVGLNMIFLVASFSHVHSSIRTMRTEPIINARRKHNCQLVVQSLIFYNVWLFLWSPHVIVSQHREISDTVAAVSQLLNYIEVTFDPIILTVLDVRFLKIWKKSFAKRTTKKRIAPVVIEN